MENGANANACRETMNEISMWVLRIPVIILPVVKLGQNMTLTCIMFNIKFFYIHKETIVCSVQLACKKCSVAKFCGNI